MAQKSEAIPTPRVYALLKAANPGAEKSEKAAKAEDTPN